MSKIEKFTPLSAKEGFRLNHAGAAPVAENTRRAGRYRLRAEELRTIARDWINDDAQTSLLKVALDYERMAESLDRINACMKNMAGSGRPN